MDDSTSRCRRDKRVPPNGGRDKGIHPNGGPYERFSLRETHL
jgi:hypothetical protein